MPEYIKREGITAYGMLEQIEIIADHYGFMSQADMLTEESAEYMVELNKFRRGKSEAFVCIKEEVADVLVVALQLRYMLGAGEIDKIMSDKVKRQLDRIYSEESFTERFKEGMKDESEN